MAQPLQQLEFQERFVLRLDAPHDDQTSYENANTILVNTFSFRLEM